MAESDGGMRDNLRYVLPGSIRDRGVGVVLLALGIMLAVAGSVLGTAS